MYNSSRIQQTSSNDLLQNQLSQSLQQIDQQAVVNTIQYLLQNTENKAYHFCINRPNSYFQLCWKDFAFYYPQISEDIVNEMSIRMKNIETQILKQKIQIKEKAPLLPFDYSIDYRTNQVNLLQQQSQNIKNKLKDINNNLQKSQKVQQMSEVKAIYEKLYSEEKIKEAEEFVRKKREEQLERERKLKEQREKEEQALQQKLEEIKNHEEQIAKEKRQQIAKKQRQLHEKRDIEKNLREERNSNYIGMTKEMKQKPPLYLKIFEGYSRRYQNQERERTQMMHSQRKSYREHLNHHNWEKHQHQYSKLKQQKQKQRKQRKTMIIKESKSRVKFFSSYQIPKKKPDPKEIAKQIAKQKLQKIKQYKNIVREKFKPKVDQTKKQQLMNLIESVQIGSRKVKKTKLPNGQFVYEKLDGGDSKMLGMEYLQMVKQMVHRKRGEKRSQKEDFLITNPVQTKKGKNYLEEIRKNRKNTSRPNKALSNMKNLSFDEKVAAVMKQSDRISEETKRNEMMLKFGKFTTSEEILHCKEAIDKNYLDQVHLKLELILNERKGKLQDFQDSQKK